MDNGSKKLGILLIVLVVTSLLFTYYRSFVSREYGLIISEPQSFEGEADDL